MNLISCENCAVVFDKDKLNFPNEDAMYTDEGIDLTIAAWDSDTESYKVKCSCPVCKEDILQ